MASMKFDRINSLEKGRTDSRIKVRVTRMCSTVSADSGTTKGYNLILLDDDVSTTNHQITCTNSLCH